MRVFPHLVTLIPSKKIDRTSHTDFLRVLFLYYVSQGTQNGTLKKFVWEVRSIFFDEIRLGMLVNIPMIVWDHAEIRNFFKMTNNVKFPFFPIEKRDVCHLKKISDLSIMPDLHESVPPPGYSDSIKKN